MANTTRKPDAAAVLTRREFVAAGVRAAAGRSLTPAAAGASTSTGSGEYGVIVTGGGFCGVTTARERRRAGYRAVVI